MHINEFFDKIYCINLDRRPDRWRNSFNQFDKLGMDVKRISAVDGSVKRFPRIPTVKQDKDREFYPDDTNIKPEEAAITYSHKIMLMDAIANGYDKILMLEDDCQFTDDFSNKFTQTVNELPEDWDLFYLGGMDWWGEPTYFSENLSITNLTLGMHAIGIRSTIFEKMLNLTNLREPVDATYAYQQANLKSYIAADALVGQTEGLYSDIKLRENIVPTFHFKRRES